VDDDPSRFQFESPAPGEPSRNLRDRLDDSGEDARLQRRQLDPAGSSDKVAFSAKPMFVRISAEATYRRPSIVRVAPKPPAQAADPAVASN
jgi:hypothetical protein